MDLHRNRSSRKKAAEKPLVDFDPQSLLYLIERFMEHLKIRHYAKTTLAGRRKYLTYFRRFCEQKGISQARRVTRAVVMEYQSYLYYYRKENGQPLAIGTQKHWMSAVTRFFSYLTREGHILYNPASDLEMPRKEFRLPRAILSAQEVEKIMQVPNLLDPMGIRDRAILEVFYSTGIRRMELCNLDIGHVDFDREVVQVLMGKGRKDRYVPIGQRALEWIERYLTDVRPSLCPSMNDHALFLNTVGRRLNVNRLGSLVHGIIKRAKVGKTGGCHLFRHTFATLLLENGCDLRYIQAMLGHSQLETTAVYTHISMRFLKQAHSRYHPTSAAKKSDTKSDKKPE